MKTKNSNLGTPLSREEQKKIRGGFALTGPCAVGNGVPDCVCNSGIHACAPATGGTPIDACNFFCRNSGGAKSASECVIGACQP